MPGTGRLPRYAETVTAPLLSELMVPDMFNVPAPLTKVPSCGVVRVSCGGLETLIVTVVVLLPPAPSVAVISMVWMPEPITLLLRVNWYLPLALGAVRVP